MTQHAMTIANQAGAAFRADLNNALGAIVTNNSGATAPATTYAYQWWADTSTGILKRRNSTNTGWVSVMTLALAISTYAESLLGAADAAATRALLVAAASGANSDITSLTALTSPFLDISASGTLTSTSYGKTNRFTAAAAATLPALSGVPAGTALSFVSNTADGTANSVVRNGSDTILFAGGSTTAPVPMRSKGDALTLLADPANTQWIVLHETIAVSFSAYKSASSQNLTTGVVTQITYDAKSYDTANAFASNVFTAPFPLKLKVFTANKFSAAITDSQVATISYINGAAQQYCYVPTNGTFAQGPGFAFEIDLATGDTVAIAMLQQMGVTATINNAVSETWFSGSR